MTRKMRIFKRIFAAVFAAAFAAAEITPAFAKEKLSADDFVHAEGRYIIGIDGERLEIRGMALGNSVWNSPTTPNLNHHTENSYRELSEMGFNCVRFYLNYEMFESDDVPYKYKESGFEWIDKNIEWAKKYNMGLILNMHCPQGGYQSQGNGTALWTDEENQKRLAGLWRAIAERYADEPTIWGYGLINEPFPPLLGTAEETLALHEKLVKTLVSEIRAAAPYQMIFTEKPNGAKDSRSGEWLALSWKTTFPIIDDSNIVYEFHCYDPFYFTHQDTGWAGTTGITMTYPSDDVISADYETYWAGFFAGQKKGTDGEWEYFESPPLTLAEDRNIGYAAVNAAFTGKDGAAYFDDITVTEIAPEGKKSVRYTYDFDNYDSVAFSSWSEDGSGEMTVAENAGRSGAALKISGTTADFTAAASNRFELKKDHQYIISGYIRRENSNCRPAVRLDFAKASNIRTGDRESLEAAIKPYADFSEEHNVPVYLGEFGVISEGFKESRNGAGWVSDMIDICRKYSIGFNYHTYHEAGFGLYLSYDNVLPDKKDRNEELAKVFIEKFQADPQNAAALFLRSFVRVIENCHTNGISAAIYHIPQTILKNLREHHI